MNIPYKDLSYYKIRIKKCKRFIDNTIDFAVEMQEMKSKHNVTTRNITEEKLLQCIKTLNDNLKNIEITLNKENLNVVIESIKELLQILYDESKKEYSCLAKNSNCLFFKYVYDHIEYFEDMYMLISVLLEIIKENEK